MTRSVAGNAVNNVPSEGLRDKRYVTVILRLLLDKQGKLVHGEMAGMNGETGPRFGSWESLSVLLPTWLASMGDGR